jgi:hypothetical protein
MRDFRASSSGLAQIHLLNIIIVTVYFALVLIIGIECFEKSKEYLNCLRKVQNVKTPLKFYKLLCPSP